MEDFVCDACNICYVDYLGVFYIETEKPYNIYPIYRKNKDVYIICTPCFIILNDFEEKNVIKKTTSKIKIIKEHLKWG